MNINFVKAERENENTVLVTYELDNKKFSVEWCNLDCNNADITTNYDLTLYVTCDNQELKERVMESIRLAEDDANHDLDLYLYIRDKFNAIHCTEI